MTATIFFSNFGGFRCSQVVFVVLEIDSSSLVGYRRWSVARGSFVCNASIVGLWLGTGGGLWLEIHLFVMLV